MSNPEGSKYKTNTLTYKYVSVTTHDKMIEAYQNYFKWNTQFEYSKSNLAGTKSRWWAEEISKLTKIRRKEILDLQHTRRAARNGKKGRPPKVTINNQ